jgi:predicted nucleotidyltransferase
LTDQIKKCLGSQLRGLWLFGLRARGDARETSDYDILILVDEKTPEMRERILDVQVDLLDNHDVLVTTVLRTEEEWRRSQDFPLARNIAREAVRL